MTTEAEQMQTRYDKRKQLDQSSLNYKLYDHLIRAEREEKFIRFLHQHKVNLREAVCLEIGAGTGGNLGFFFRLGAKPGNVFANELLPDRQQHLREHFPHVQLIPGDATELNMARRFDVILVSTVFSSVLDNAAREQLAKAIASFLSERGVLLWYDFVYDNPKNPDVKGMPLRDVKQMFSPLKISGTYNVTLLPPLGRMFPNQYHLLNGLLPFLRTHVACAFVR